MWLLLLFILRSNENNRQPDYLKAVNLMCAIASEASDLAIAYRIQSLEKALASSQLAYQKLTSGAASPVKPIALPANQSMESYFLDNIQQFKDMIEVASKSI